MPTPKFWRTRARLAGQRLRDDRDRCPREWRGMNRALVRTTERMRESERRSEIENSHLSLCPPALFWFLDLAGAARARA